MWLIQDTDENLQSGYPSQSEKLQYTSSVICISTSTSPVILQPKVTDVFTHKHILKEGEKEAKKEETNL